MKKFNNFYIFDGAMGTYYQKVGQLDISCERANLLDSRTIKDIHKAYIDSGAMAIKTNTFAAHSGLFSENTRDEIIRKAVDIAFEAVHEKNIDVFASIGPLPKDIINPKKEFEDIVNIFLEKGIDKFLFETLDSPEHMADIANYIKSKNPKAYVQVSFAVNSQGETSSGFLGQYLLDSLAKEEAIDGLGFNCILSPYHMNEYLESLDLPKNKNISIMPNAGYPEIVGRRAVYKKDPDYFFQGMKKIASMGIPILGGCCGTCPEDIKALSQGLKGHSLPELRENIKEKNKVLKKTKIIFSINLSLAKKSWP